MPDVSGAAQERGPFPIPLQIVHQVEITSRCSLKCVYCPSPQITGGKQPNRPALDMKRDIYLRTLEWVRHCVDQHGQIELNLAGIGESTLHPEFVDFVRLAREVMGPDRLITFATNGIPRRGTDLRDLVAALAPYLGPPHKPGVWVSLHRPEHAGLAVDLYLRAGMLAGVSADPSVRANDWAGQVQWVTSPLTELKPITCPWLRDGRAMVMADGRITTCCLDASGIGVVGTVWQEIGSIELQPYELCRTCYQKIENPRWDQRAGRLAGALP